MVQPGATYTVGASNIVFTAQWASAVTRTITYSTGGAFGTKPAQSPVAVGASFTVAASTGLSKTGSSFGGWSDGVRIYQPGDKYTVGASDISLIATWIAAITRTVTFQLGDFTGTVPAPISVREGVTFIAPSGAGLVRAGSRFVFWSNGTSNYLPGGSYKMGSVDLVLTAVWRKG